LHSQHLNWQAGGPAGILSGLLPGPLFALSQRFRSGREKTPETRFL
jgi:hypothetical protein